MLGLLLFELSVGELKLTIKIFQFPYTAVLCFPYNNYNIAWNNLQADINIFMGPYGENQIAINVSKLEVLVQTRELYCNTRFCRSRHVNLGYTCLELPCFEDRMTKLYSDLSVTTQSSRCENCARLARETVKCANYLWFYIDNHLNWYSLVQHICKKLRKLTRRL